MSFEPSKTKGDALRRIGDLLGYKFDLSEGSTVPTALFTAAAQRAGVSDSGSMPVRGERVVQKAGLLWDSKCDSRNAPSGGGSTVTLTGLNRLLEALMALGVSTPAAPPIDTGETLGISYRERTGGVEAAPTALLQDWNALDESSRAHMELQNSLADYVRSLNVEPRSPSPSDPAFDLAWEHDGTTVVVEVKSANDANHRQQARLGIGQVLEYAAILNDSLAGDYRPVLLLGEAPSDLDYLLATSSGVVVIGPDQFNELGLEELLPLGPSGE
jgi:hypothetical protein